LLLRRDLRLWQAFWIGGAVLAALTAALVWAAERAHGAGQPGLGALLDALRLVAYLFWFHAVWRSSRNVERALWSAAARAAAALGLLASAVLY
jgi:hypothetical protein